MMLAFLRVAFINGFQYKSRYLLNLLGEFIYIYIRISIWLVLLRWNIDVSETFEEMCAFVFLNAILLTATLSGTGYRLSKRIISGDIATDLIKPYKVQSMLLMQEASSACFNLCFITLPVLLILTIIYRLAQPPSFSMLIYALVIGGMGLLLNYYLYYLLALFVVWLKNDWYIEWLSGALMTLFGGSFVPLWMYPEWLSSISRFLPFQYMRYQSIAIYLGHSEIEPLSAILITGLWCIVLYASVRLVSRRAEYKLSINGG